MRGRGCGYGRMGDAGERGWLWRGIYGWVSLWCWGRCWDYLMLKDPAEWGGGHWRPLVDPKPVIEERVSLRKYPESYPVRDGSLGLNREQLAGRSHSREKRSKCA